MTMSPHSAPIPTPMGLAMIPSHEKTEEVHGGWLDKHPCFFPACMSCETRSLKHILMRQAVSVCGDADADMVGRRSALFVGMACAYHSDLTRARKAKKKLSLTQRTRLRYILDTLNYLFGVFGQIVLKAHIARLTAAAN